MKIDEDFVPLLHAGDHVELSMAEDLLKSEEIPYVVDRSDRYEMLHVLQGQSAEGLQCVLVPKSRLDQAESLLADAWGSEAFAAKRVRVKGAE